MLDGAHRRASAWSLRLVASRNAAEQSVKERGELINLGKGRRQRFGIIGLPLRIGGRGPESF